MICQVSMWSDIVGDSAQHWLPFDIDVVVTYQPRFQTCRWCNLWAFSCYTVERFLNCRWIKDLGVQLSFHFSINHTRDQNQQPHGTPLPQQYTQTDHPCHQQARKYCTPVTLISSAGRWPCPCPQRLYEILWPLGIQSCLSSSILPTWYYLLSLVFHAWNQEMTFAILFPFGYDI
jgi:hypothetical protein